MHLCAGLASLHQVCFPFKNELKLPFKGIVLVHLLYFVKSYKCTNKTEQESCPSITKLIYCRTYCYVCEHLITSPMSCNSLNSLHAQRFEQFKIWIQQRVLTIHSKLQVWDYNCFCLFNSVFCSFRLCKYFSVYSDSHFPDPIKKVGCYHWRPHIFIAGEPLKNKLIINLLPQR